MTKGRRGLESKRSQRGRSWVHTLMGIALASSLLLACVVWLIPIEVVEQWALDRAGNDAYARMEAIGGAEFSVWLVRILALVLPLLIVMVWWDLNRWHEWFRSAVQGSTAASAIQN